MDTKLRLGIEDIIGSKRDVIIRIAQKHGASNVRVFGSVARVESTPTSDVDLLVDQDWSQLSAWGGMALVIELEDLLGRKVDVATEEELKPFIKQRGLAEAVPL